MTDMYLYTCSTDSLQYHPQNNPKRIELYIKGGENGTDNIFTKPVYLTLHLTNKL